jgi:hypothetical protein
MESTLLMSVGAIFAFVVFYQLEERSWLERLVPNYTLTYNWEFEMWQCASAAVIGLVGAGSSLVILISIGVVKQILLRIQERCDKTGFINGMIFVSTLGGLIVGKFSCLPTALLTTPDSLLVILFSCTPRSYFMGTSADYRKRPSVHNIHYKTHKRILHAFTLVHCFCESVHAGCQHELWVHRRIRVSRNCNWSDCWSDRSPAVRLLAPRHDSVLFHGCDAQWNLPHAFHSAGHRQLHALPRSAADGAGVHRLHHCLPHVHRYWADGGAAEPSGQECEGKCQEKGEGGQGQGGRTECLQQEGESV